MEMQLPALRREEKIALQLRCLFEQRGYQLFRMGSFEEYDLYMQNRAFLMGDDIISFTAADGRLLALKPDVTLSIVKNTPADATRRIYYCENVFRRNKQSGSYREIEQMGLEYIGGDDIASEIEVLTLAAQSLAAAGNAALDLSHMEFIDAMLSLFGDEALRATARAALRDKSPHLMCAAAKSAGLSDADTARLSALVSLSGAFPAALANARAIASDFAAAQAALDELEALYQALAQTQVATKIRLDFSILNDTDYYNGLIFQGFVSGVSHAVLYGGRYDNLLRRFEKPQGAIGFALYLDALGRVDSPNGDDPTENDGFLNIALPKGRLGNDIYRLFVQAGFSCDDLIDESRKLVFEDTASRVRYYLVKPSDVDIYVEHGVADIGVVGKDVLSESGADVLELLDLNRGCCRFAIAGKPDFQEDPALPLRVATKYPNMTRRYFASQSRAVEIIQLHGSIELAPLIGLSDVIVDIVETGSTIKENNLEILAELEPSSARLIANRASWRFQGETIRTLIEKLGELL